MEHSGSTFLCGCVADLEMIFCAKSLDSLVDRDTENSSFFMLLDGEWYKYQFDGAWPAVSMATIKPTSQERTVVAISSRGAYWEVLPKAVHETHGAIGEQLEPLRSLSVVDDVVYACGMGRTVLRRTGTGVWNEIGPGLSDDDEGEIVGFESLAGFSSNEMYAAGWRGELWQYLAGSWRRLDSPVSANLNAVCCAADGNVYVVGDGGIMLRGRGETWEAIESERIENFMDVAYYGRRAYVSTDFELLKYENDTLTAEDAFADPDDLPGTCLHLYDAADGLVSIGTKDLFRLRDGLWERLV